jgi:hypothetical protein
VRAARKFGAGAAALAAALIALAVAATGASALLVKVSNGHLYGINLHRGLTASSLPSGLSAQGSSTATTAGQLAYHGGPVLQSTEPYLIFWDPSGTAISSGSRALLARYFTDVALDSGKTSNVYAVDWQYTDGSGDSAGRATSFSTAQVIDDSQSFPPRNTSSCSIATTWPKCLTDAQLRAEVSRLRAADGLPSGTGANAPIYFVVTPGDTNICLSSSSCTSNTFCAYHSSFANGSSDVLYSAIPLFFDGASSTQNPKNCQDDGNSAPQEPNGDQADVAIKYLSHEDNETITDALGNAWFSSSGNEDGDNCNFFGSFAPNNGTNPNAFTPTLGGSASAGTLFNQLINGHEYYIQSEWSNSAGTCKLWPASISVTVSPSSIPADGRSEATATATVLDNGVPVTGANVSFTSSDPGEVIGTTVDHGGGTYTATITASTTAGTATITATNNSGTPVESASTKLTQTKPPSVKVALNPGVIVADGRSTTTATATVMMGLKAVNGATVSFTSTDPGETISAVTPLGGGKYSVKVVASHTVGSATITAAANGGHGSATLKQISPKVTVAVKPTSIVANGQSTAVVTATVTANFKAINGDAIAFTSSDPGERIGPVTNPGNGKYTATITSSTTAGTATITATDTSVSPSPAGHTTLKQT